jgi:hypothetical protein
MDYLKTILSAVDPFLIAPYRWIDNPMMGWWLGTFILGIWASILGELTLAAGYRINRTAVSQRLNETSYYQERSINALKSGDKRSYKAINQLANDAFGKSFFLLMAMGMSSLWPVFLAGAWLQSRFGDVRFSLPFFHNGLNFIPFFIICYVMARLLVSAVKKRMI